jgi:hypothetical protein
MSKFESSADSQLLTIEFGKLLYYQKPVLGNDGSRSNNNGDGDNLPLQLIFPSGNFGLGVPINLRRERNEHRSDITAIVSVPENTDQDIAYRRGIVIIFLCVFLFNLVITILLYTNASVVDLSRVEPYDGIQFLFGKVPSERSYAENVSFGFTLLILIIGAIGAILEQPTILSAFCYSLLMNFILGTQSLPYYAYSMRYLLDAFLLYMGLLLRQKCSPAFLPVHIHSS